MRTFIFYNFIMGSSHELSFDYDAERQAFHSHAERGNELPTVFFHYLLVPMLCVRTANILFKLFFYWWFTK